MLRYYYKHKYWQVDLDGLSGLFLQSSPEDAELSGRLNREEQLTLLRHTGYRYRRIKKKFGRGGLRLAPRKNHQ
jgi:hypothetical protein